MMSLTSMLLFRAGRPARPVEDDFGKDHSLNYVLAFATLGMFVTLMALALDLDVASF